jgi:hypothetical protein
MAEKQWKLIVDTGCDCPININSGKNQDVQIYNNPIWQPYPSENLSFNVGDYVYAIKTGTDYYSKATVIEKLENDNYVIQFEDNITQTSNISELKIYFPCNCSSEGSYNGFFCDA